MQKDIILLDNSIGSINSTFTIQKKEIRRSNSITFTFYIHIIGDLHNFLAHILENEM